MSAKDKFHDEVKRALIKNRWVVTDDPLKIQSEGKRFEIDFGAERLIFADRGVEKIAIEVKSFLNPSAMTDFYGAMGQFLTYRLALKQEQPERTLYLAVPKDSYDVFFDRILFNLRSPSIHFYWLFIIQFRRLLIN